MAHLQRQHRRPRIELRPELFDLYDYQRSAPKLGRPPAQELSTWRVIDDWPRRVPVTSEEVDVFEAWFGDLLDELFGPA